MCTCKSTDGGANWTVLGPPAAGFGLAIDPANPATVYAAGPAGVSKSADGGGSWNLINSGLTNRFVESIVIDPANTNTLYVGTGGGNFPGTVFKSTNRGTSWNPVSTGLAGIRDVVALVIDSANTGTVFAGSEVGVFKTTNGGVSWAAVNSGLTSTNIRALTIIEITVGCTYSIAPTRESFPASGGSGSVAVMTMNGCMWTATSNVSWITITSGSSGNGNGTVAYSVAANSGASSRTQALTIASQTFTVIQAGTPEGSALTVAPQSLSFSAVVGAASQRQTLQVGSDAGTVNWTATVELLNGTGWLTVSPGSGTATLEQAATITVEVNFGALAAGGVFQAVITVTDTASDFSVTVPVQAVVTLLGGRLVLDQTAFVFRVAEGGFAPPAQTLQGVEQQN